jgi:hypothetical protein
LRQKNIQYQFAAKPWQHQGPGGWYFVSLPVKLSNEIRTVFKMDEEGWGRLKAVAQIGSTEWKTAIWFDTKRNAYLLPLKAEIRKKEQLLIDKIVQVTIWV